MVIVIILLAIMLLGYVDLFILWRSFNKTVTRYVEKAREVGELMDALNEDLDKFSDELDKLCAADDI